MPSMAVIESMDIDADSIEGSLTEQKPVAHPAATTATTKLASREISPDAAEKTKKSQKAAKQASLFAFFGKRQAIPSPLQIKKVRNKIHTKRVDKQPKAALDPTAVPVVVDSTNSRIQPTSSTKEKLPLKKLQTKSLPRKGTRKYKVHKKSDFLHICTGTLQKPNPVDEELLASLQHEDQPKGKDGDLLLPVIPTLESCLRTARVLDVDSDQGKEETSDSLKVGSPSIGTDENQNKKHNMAFTTNQLHSTDSPEIEPSSEGPSVTSKEDGSCLDKDCDPTAMETSIDSAAVVASSKGPSVSSKEDGSCLDKDCDPIATETSIDSVAVVASSEGPSVSSKEDGSCLNKACDPTTTETSIDSAAVVASSKGPSVSPDEEGPSLSMDGGEACDSTAMETSIDSSIKETTGADVDCGRADAEELMSDSNDPTESMDFQTESLSSPPEERSEQCVEKEGAVQKCNGGSSSEIVVSELKESSLENQSVPMVPPQEFSEQQSKSEIAQSEIEISHPGHEGSNSSIDISKSDVVSTVVVSKCEEKQCELATAAKGLLQKPEIPNEDSCDDVAEGAKSNCEEHRIVSPTKEAIPTKESPETVSVARTDDEKLPLERPGLPCDSDENSMSCTYNGKHMNSPPEQTDDTHMIAAESQTSTEQATVKDSVPPHASPSRRNIKKTPNDATSMKEAGTVASKNLIKTTLSVAKPATTMTASLPQSLDKFVTTEESRTPRRTTSRQSKRPSVENPTQTDSTNPLEQKMLDLMGKHEKMREMYRKKALKHLSEFVEQDLKIDISNPDEFHETSDEFPDAAVPYLVSYIEGSKLPLSNLTPLSCEQLNKAFSAFNQEFTLSSVSTKINMLATRKDYAKNLSISSELRCTIDPVINVTEDGNLDHLWRWEVTSLELLPSSSLTDVKKARALWRKFSAHFNAMTKLMLCLDELIKILRDSKGSDLPKSKVDKSLIKIDREEQKVLKFEREQEKTRLIAEARRKKHEAKEQKLREEKARLAEEKRKQKQEAVEAREELKRKKEEKQRIELEQETHRKEKQRSLMMSFFKATKTENTTSSKAGPTENTTGSKAGLTENTTSNRPDLSMETPKEEVPETKECSCDQGNTFDAEKFRSSINSLKSGHSPLFDSLSKRAVRSRRRKSRRVSVTVHVVSSTSNEGFDVQPYLEEREVEFLNRYRFLRFHEDLRPPYYGTWSKSSDVISGRTPFRKDTAHLDYDNDSEAEWEEGDDEPGEDVENEAGDEDENMDGEEGEVYNYEDGWLAADDDLGCEDEIDEETKLLRKNKHHAEESESKLKPVCIVAPGKGGVPIVATSSSVDDPFLDDRIYGISKKAGWNLVLAHNGEEMNTELFLDAFPPLLTEENDIPEESSATKQTNSESKQVSKELSGEDLKKFAGFVHYSTYLSKPKVVDEFRASNAEATSSRAQTFRTLDSIAEKKRHPSGVYWEVKQSVLRDLGLEELLQKKPPFKEVDKKGEEESQKEIEKKVDPKNGKIDRSSRKRKPSIESLASAQVLASFLKRAKKSPDK